MENNESYRNVFLGGSLKPEKCDIILLHEKLTRNLMQFYAVFNEHC